MKIIIALYFVLFPLFLFSQTITIAEARAKADGVSVTVEGIALNGNELGVIRYIQDNTAAIAVYDAGLKDSKRGDKISVTGTLKSWNNLLEISPVTSSTIISSNNPLPPAVNKSIQEVFSEQFEGRLITLTGITFTNSGTFSGSSNYDIKQGNYTGQIRIDNNSNIAGTTIPAGKTNITGIMGQYKSTYQLLPRDLTDLGFMNSNVSVKEIETNALTLSFKTLETGKGIIKYGLTRNLEMGEETGEDNTRQHEIKISGLTPATFYYIKAQSVRSSGDTVFSGIYYFTTASESSGKIIAYFNNPVDHSFADGSKAVYLNRLIDDTLAAYIGRAKESIDVAIYNFNNSGLSTNISSALNSAFNRGVKIRVIADGSSAGLGLNELNGKISVLRSPTGLNYKIMHNKFIVFDANSTNPDQPVVWTGSTNLTADQVNSDPNNVIIIQDQALAKAYTLEFNEMWGSAGLYPNSLKSKFGSFKSDNTPHFFSINGYRVDCYFSPSDNVNSKIIDAVNTADASIYFATYVFTRTSIAYPIKDKYDQGVYVAGIFGDIGGSNDPAYNVLSPAIGKDIKLYSGSGLFHHKYAIIDYARTFQDIDPLVITGSHNWSASADNDNDENTLIVHNKTLASLYFQEWAQRFQDEGGTVFVSINDEQGEKSVQNLKACIFNNDLSVFISSDQPQEAVFDLYAINGLKLFSKKQQLAKGSNNLQFLLPGLPGQIYVLRVSSENINEVVKLMKK